MKRRNAEGTKPRRLVKRSKITEGIYGSTFLYLKFLLVWILVLMADFLVEFRFEYLWPFWLLLRSVYDSFKYQGLAFSVFFVFIAITSDVVCYLFIPMQWLFFAASTYVWVQYVWHTERGICLPTISLWLLFVYIEASVRLRDFKTMSTQFQLDLCRPFAAHCIGYPVVTLGFGFKSYVSYRLRLRRQVVVRKENDFYMQLLTQALPVEQQNLEKQKAAALPSKSQEEGISNGMATSPPPGGSNNSSSQSSSASSTTANASQTSSSASSGSSSHKQRSSQKCGDRERDTSTSSTAHADVKKNNASVDYEYIEQSLNKSSMNHYEEDNLTNEQHVKSYKANSVTKTNKLNSQKDNTASLSASSKKGKSSNTTAQYANNKDEVIVRLESDIKRLKADLQASRNCEQELRSQINNMTISDKALKSEVYQLRQDNENLQNKLHNLVTSKQQDKQTLSILERRLQDERKQRQLLESQLIAEKKKRTEETTAARALAMAQAVRVECTEACKARRRELDNDIKQSRRELKLREDQLRQLERETETLRQYKDAQNETEVLMSALQAMQEKNSHLENNLSAETRLKMDLFSALGDAKRQVEIQQGLLQQKEAEINELERKIAEVMAVLPSTSSFTTPSSGTVVSHFSSTFTNAGSGVLTNSTLNPNASDYTPIVTE